MWCLPVTGSDLFLEPYTCSDDEILIKKCALQILGEISVSISVQDPSKNAGILLEFVD